MCNCSALYSGVRCGTKNVVFRIPNVDYQRYTNTTTYANHTKTHVRNQMCVIFRALYNCTVNTTVEITPGSIIVAFFEPDEATHTAMRGALAGTSETIELCLPECETCQPSTCINSTRIDTAEAPTPPPKKKKDHTLAIALSAAAGGVVVIGLVLFFVLHKTSRAPISKKHRSSRSSGEGERKKKKRKRGHGRHHDKTK